MKDQTKHSSHAEIQTGDTPPFKAGRQEWLGLAVLALPTLLLSLDLSVLYLALPHLVADLGPSSSQMLWIMDIYGFMIAGFLVTMGTLGDRIGRRRLLIIGSAAFGVASVLAAYSTSAEMLIATRALLGIAGATLMPSTLALISNMFRDPKQRGLAISVWMSCFMGGTAIGPLIGGVLLQYFWWGSVFLLGVPVMVLVLICAPSLLPEYRDPQAGRLDLTSVVLSLASILPIIYGIKEIAKDGLHGLPVASIAIGTALGYVFVRRQRRLSAPLLDLHLFSNRSFSAALGIMVISGAAMGGIFLLVSQYLQLVAEMSPLRAGLWLLPQAFSMILGSMLAPAIARRFGTAQVIAAGMLLAVIGLLLLTQVESTGGMAVLMAGFVIASTGLAPMGVLSTDLVIGSAPPERAGSASAMSETSGELGIALGVAVMGSVGTAVYRNRMDGALPDNTPEEAAQATLDTLAGAAVAADQLPEQIGTVLLATAKQAFTSGLHTVAGFNAAILLLLAVLTMVMLRHVRLGAEAEPSVQGEDGYTNLRA